MPLRLRQASTQRLLKPRLEQSCLSSNKRAMRRKVAQLFQQLPGAAELAQKHAVVAGSGGGLLGTLSGVADKVVGGGAGILVAALAQLEATNLSAQQIKNIGTAFLAYIKEECQFRLGQGDRRRDPRIGQTVWSPGIIKVGSSGPLIRKS